MAVDVFRLPQPIRGAGALYSLATNSGVRRDGIAAGTRKEKNEPEAGNLLGTALNPCQNFGMFVRTAMLSHCGGHGSGGRDPPAGLVAGTRHATAVMLALKIGWREGCLLDIVKPSVCRADSGGRGEKY